jgi:hypothetical protein
MVLVSFAEVLSLGAIVPFLAALTNPKQVFELPIAQPFIQLAGIQSEGELLLPLTLLFGFTAIIAGAMRLYCSRSAYVCHLQLALILATAFTAKHSISPTSPISHVTPVKLLMA